MRWPGTFVAAALVVGLAGPSAAGQVKLTLRGGMVTLDAKDATVREILAEWARVGQTRVVNGENVTGGPVTLQLTDVPERQALETLLRASAGFIAATRAELQPTLSTYDRIVLMPGVRPAAALPGSSPAQGNPMAMGRAGQISAPQVIIADEDQDPSDPEPPMQMPPMIQRPGMPTGSPYSPVVGQFGAPPAPQQPTPQPFPQRPGVPTAPPQPIKQGPGGQ